MPTKFAVRTSILSKRWRYAWMFITKLDIEVINCPIQKVVEQIDSVTKFVDRVLKCCKTSQLQLFLLRFHTLWVLTSSVSNWIDEAVKLNVCELDIQAMKLGLPLSMFTCKTLTVLRLDNCGHEPNDWECPSYVNLPCLKTLDIVVFTNPLRNALKLICGCPTLESFSLEVSWRNDKEDYIFSIPTLKQLKLTWRKCTSLVKRVVLQTPNLEYLYVGGELGSLFVMGGVSSLVEATFSFRIIRFYHLWFELLKGVNGVKSLSAQNVTSLVDFKIPFTSPLPNFPNMKHLELKGVWHPVLILQFLERSPGLKHLCAEKVSKQCFKKPKESSWVEPKGVPGCMLTNLTTIKFSIFEDFSIEEEKWLCAEELKLLPKASRCCEIHFH